MMVENQQSQPTLLNKQTSKIRSALKIKASEINMQLRNDFKIFTTRKALDYLKEIGMLI
jgi:hypothetical protein